MGNPNARRVGLPLPKKVPAGTSTSTPAANTTSKVPIVVSPKGTTPAQHVITKNTQHIDKRCHSEVKTWTFFKNRDPLHKDFVIRNDGAERNCVKVTGGFHPNGEKFQIITDIFPREEYDFVEHFRSMSPQEQEEVLRSRSVEILVTVRPQDIEKISKADGSPISQTSTQSGILNQLNLLGRSFTKKIWNLTVTFEFVAGDEAQPISTPKFTDEKIDSAGLRAARASFDGQIPSGAVYRLVQGLTKRINYFHNVKRMTVNLHLPGQEQLSGKHLMMVLFLYDMHFVDWELFWRNESMEKASEVTDAPLKWMLNTRLHISNEQKNIERALSSPTMPELGY